MFDAIVIGSGAAGAWAAYGLAHDRRRVLVLDVGKRPPEQGRIAGRFLDIRTTRRTERQDLLGAHFETLNNIVGPYQSPKLNAPRFRFVTDQAEQLAPVRSGPFTTTQSLAYGGLANAWGAGAYRFTGADLASFPLDAGALEPFYDEITRSIGISGADDDLGRHFGSTTGLQPPLTLDRLGSHALAKYERQRARFRTRGFTMGRPRLAVLSQPLGDRKACSYDNLTFWEPTLDYVYVPSRTLDPLIESGRVEYVSGVLALRFREVDGHVEVTTRNLESGQHQTFSAARLVLAAGALNSARLVLQSFDDHDARQPVLDNLPSMVPLAAPRFIGAAHDESSHGLGQLNIVYRPDEGADYLQGTFYSYTSLLASEVLTDFPLPLRGSMAAARYILPALSVVTFFYPDRPHPENRLQLASDGALEISYEAPPATGDVERRFMEVMRGCGFYSHRALCRVSPRGAGIHYAGTLPMSASGSTRYSTLPSGSLRQSPRVYAADAAVFPTLPAKNHTLTVMANALRVGREVSASLGRP